jgi:CRISPR-associated protein Cas2
LLELKAGVFVGRPSALVRDKLWEKACKKARDGGCVMAYRTNNEQGYDIKIFGDYSRHVADYEGLQLIKRPLPPSKATETRDEQAKG